MERHVCVHGHFYQPPRENPWLESIEVQDSAFPYHDWNERITTECYGPNARSRILDAERRILRIANNYSRISFNFGPTLLAWMESRAPETYRAIIDADRAGAERFSGHGNALAQAYNHMILPLAAPRDRRTQVVWGIRDFEHRFGRRPEGMWLPETAVDNDSLEALAEQGIRFTILSPYQAARVRRMGARSWREVGFDGIDPSTPYRANLPSGRCIDIFFYDGPISRAVAFEGLLNSGERFAARLMDGFSDSRSWAQLVHIATDGESYGHHHRHGDMALAFALDSLESGGAVRLTNYGEFLDLHPAAHEVEIRDGTSWSCVHGVERWRSDCGCSSGSNPDWTQAWRGPLRTALDFLRDSIQAPFEERAGIVFQDPWRARDEYVEVLLDPSIDTRARFLAEHAWAPLEPDARVRAWKLMELQRHAMLMYTSCGWFFDDVSGIETVQLLRYAGRVIQLARDALGLELEAQFLELASRARSNLPEQRDGALVYASAVRPSIVDLPKVAAHQAVISLFEGGARNPSIDAYAVQRQDHHLVSAGRVRLAVGRARIESAMTGESLTTAYAAIHFGDHNVSAAVDLRPGAGPYEDMVEQLLHDFRRADLAGVIRVLDRSFAITSFSLPVLFRDAQRDILAEILDSNLADAAEAYREVYERHAPLLRFLKDIDSPRPEELVVAARVVLERRLRSLLGDEWLDPGAVADLMADAENLGVPMDSPAIRFAFERSVERLAAQLSVMPNSNEVLQRLRDAVALARRLPFEVDLWSIQNIYWELLNRVYPGEAAKVAAGDEAAARWLDNFVPLGEELMVRVELEPGAQELRSLVAEG